VGGLYWAWGGWRVTIADVDFGVGALGLGRERIFFQDQHIINFQHSVLGAVAVIGGFSGWGICRRAKKVKGAHSRNNPVRDAEKRGFFRKNGPRTSRQPRE